MIEKFTLFVTTGNPKGFGHKNATAGDGGSMLLAGRRLGGMDGGPEGPPGPTRVPRRGPFS